MENKYHLTIHIHKLKKKYFFKIFFFHQTFVNLYEFLLKVLCLFDGVVGVVGVVDDELAAKEIVDNDWDLDPSVRNFSEPKGRGEGPRFLSKLEADPLKFEGV